MPLLHNANHKVPQSSHILEMYKSTDPELILEGPAETSKTYSILDKLLIIASKRYVRILILRKEKTAVYGNIITDINKILKYKLSDRKCEFSCRGGTDKPDWLTHKITNAQIVFGGVDDVDKHLGAGFDIIFVSQAEQLTEDEWEVLVTRNTGRAGNWKDENGDPLSQLIADCNPKHPSHWIPRRAKEGRTKLIKTNLWDNAANFYNGKRTKQGERTYNRLDESLVGIRRDRLFHGKWCSAEGAVYQLTDENFLDKEPKNISSWIHIRGIDFGYDHPFAVVWAAYNKDEIIIYQTWKAANLTIDECVEAIKQNDKYKVHWSVADHSAGDVEYLRRNGIPTKKAIKDTLLNVSHVQRRIQDKTLKIVKGSLINKCPVLINRRWPLQLEDEMDNLEYPTNKYGRNVDKPKDGKDDLENALRYICTALENVRNPIGFGTSKVRRQTRV